MGNALQPRHFADADADEEASWFQRLLLVVNSVLSQTVSASRWAYLFDRRFSGTQCLGRCEHPECEGVRIPRLPVRPAKPWRAPPIVEDLELAGPGGQRRQCSLEPSHSGDCLCALHAPRVVVDIRVYRPWQ